MYHKLIFHASFGKTRIIFRVRLIYFIITTFLISDWRMSTWTMLASTVHSSQCLYPSITTKMKIKMSDAILGYNMDLLFDLISSFSFLKHLFAPSFILSFFICWEFKCKYFLFASSNKGALHGWLQKLSRWLKDVMEFDLS